MLTATPRPADIFTTAAVPGRSAALDVCVASRNAAATRGDAAQAAFDRKLSNYRNEIPRVTFGIHYRLVWTADGRPQPAVTRTLQYAAEIASSRNGQQMSAKSLQRRWKHESQIALLRWRAAMTRADLPNSSARAEWFLAGILDRALHHFLAQVILAQGHFKMRGCSLRLPPDPLGNGDCRRQEKIMAASRVVAVPCEHDVKRLPWPSVVVPSYGFY